MTEPPQWGPDHAAVRALWTLDPEVAYLNHGSFGATPLPVLDEQARLRADLEREPVDFLERTYADRVASARHAVAAFLGADPDGLAFLSNATTGVATAVAAVEPGPGDEIVTTDHAYAAVRIGLRSYADRQGARLVEVSLPLDGADLAGAVLAAIGPRTRLVVVDAVTSPTALELPVAEIVAGCRAAGVPCVVDAAHAPGMLPVDLSALDADFWSGNLHKWACTPKGAAVLAVREDWRDRVHPLVLSHGAGQGFTAEFDWSGTHDPTAWLAAPVALTLLTDIGWDRLREYGRALARWGADLVAGAVGRPLPAVPTTQMSLVDPGPLSHAEGVALNGLLWSEHRIEVPVTEWGERRFVRLSAQAYNQPSDYERLAAALPAALARIRSGST